MRFPILPALIVASSTTYIEPAMANVAHDDASNAPYADGWDAGDNGGAGFGPWAFAFSGDPAALDAIYGMDPNFIDGVGLGPLPGNALGAPAFGLTTSARPFFGDTAEATRTLNAPLAIGQTFSADVDGSELDPAAPGFSIGNTFQLFGSDAVERFGMFTNNGFLNDNWVAPGNTDTGISAGSSFHIDFALTGVDTYDLVLTPVGGGAPLFSQIGATLGGTAGVSIDSIRISAYGTGSSSDGSRELFVNNLSIVPEPLSVTLMVFAALAFSLVMQRRR